MGEIDGIGAHLTRPRTIAACLLSLPQWIPIGTIRPQNPLQLQADRRRRNERSVRCVCSIRGTVVEKEETDTVNEISVAKQ